jgi:hypothetical protein
MESLAYLVRLSTAGLLLDVNTFRAQRDNPYALREGFLVVLIVGILVSVTSLIGDLLGRLASPDLLAVLEIVQRSMERTAFVVELQRINPDFNLNLIFNQLASIFSILQWSGIISALITPFVYLLGWLIYGIVAHLAARALGGEGTFAQTLGCTALASGANLLAIAQIIPFVEIAGTTLLGLIGCYIGLRTAHNLSAWRAFWAALLGPILLGLLLLVISCGGIAVLVAAAQGS